MSSTEPDAFPLQDVVGLQSKIADLEETLDAIRLGGVDAILVGAPGAEKVYTLASAERPYKTIVEQMSEGACTVSERHVVLFANTRFADMVGVESSRIVGTRLSAYVQPGYWDVVVALLSVLPGGDARVEVELSSPTGTVPVALSAACLDIDGVRVRCLVATDLESQKTDQAALEREVAERTSELAVTNAVLVKVNRTLAIVNKGEQVLMHATDEPTFIDEICRVILDTGHYPLVWVGRAESDPTRSVSPIGAAGKPVVLETTVVSWGPGEFGLGPTGRAIRSQTTQVDQDVLSSTDCEPWLQQARDLDVRSACALPLTMAGFSGALTIYSSEPNAFDAASIELLEGLAQDLCYGLERLRDSARLRRSLDSTITAVAAASELRDPYTAGHQRRVAEIAAAISHRLGIEADERQGIVVAATIHDIGKLIVPSEILSKPGRLTPHERALLMNHSQAGHDIVSGIDFPWPVAEMILQHHERIDGSGYPNGLSAHDLLLGSRIIAVADVVEAMSSHRPYRPALGLDVALAEIERYRGVHYDEAVVDACLFVCRHDTLVFNPDGSAPFGTLVNEFEEMAVAAARLVDGDAPADALPTSPLGCQRRTPGP